MEEELALKNLRSNEDIVIQKADKGGATVVLDREDYNNKMIDHLTTSGSYTKLSKKPICIVIREVNKAIMNSKFDNG